MVHFIKCNVFKFQVLIAIFSCAAIVTCLCVCIFTALHLFYLTPMKCRALHGTIPHTYAEDAITVTPANQDRLLNGNTEDPIVITSNSNESYNTTDVGKELAIEPTGINIDSPESTTPSAGTIAGTDSVDEGVEDFESSGHAEPVENLKDRLRKNPVKREETHVDEEIDEEEGSGSDQSDGLINATEHLELDSVTGESVFDINQRTIYVEYEYCVCESWNGHWKRTFRYIDLTCLEVNRILPVLSVATCIVTIGGAILSGIMLYLLWASKSSFYDPIRPSEVRPIIFSSSLRRNNSMQSKINGAQYWNGVNSTNRNGNVNHFGFRNG